MARELNLLFILTSDHGEMLGDHYRFRKSVAYEGSARVPFLLSAPPRFGVDPGGVVGANLPAGQVIGTVTHFSATVTAPGQVHRIAGERIEDEAEVIGMDELAARRQRKTS